MAEQFSAQAVAEALRRGDREEALRLLEEQQAANSAQAETEPEELRPLPVIYNAVITMIANSNVWDNSEKLAVIDSLVAEARS